MPVQLEGTPHEHYKSEGNGAANTGFNNGETVQPEYGVASEDGFVGVMDYYQNAADAVLEPGNPDVELDSSGVKFKVQDDGLRVQVEDDEDSDDDETEDDDDDKGDPKPAAKKAPAKAATPPPVPSSN